MKGLRGEGNRAADTRNKPGNQSFGCFWCSRCTGPPTCSLGKDGLVSKERAPYDGRAVQPRLTDAGREAITSAFRAHKAREQEWAGSLSEDELHTLIGLLGKLTTHSTHFDARHRM